jgi:multiple sugar transport system substrate-binding protein
MCKQVIVLAAALIMAPLGARGADLVVWWSEGYYAQEGEAVREIITAFEQKTGKQVELILHPEQELPDKLVAAVKAGQPPDFAFSLVNTQYDEQWAYEGRLVDLTDAIGWHDGPAWPLPAADGVRDSPRARVEKPARARRLHAR